MLRFADFYADRQQTTDKPIALPLAVYARTQGNNCSKYYTSDIKFPKRYSKFTTVVQHS